jgi:valyl-tRNA synthetase
MNISPSKKIDAIITSSAVKDYQLEYIKKLALVENITIGDNLEKPHASASAVFKNLEIYVPLEGIIDLDIERKRMDKELKRLEGLLTGLDKKLSNENFISNAPAEVVEKEKAKRRDWQDNCEKLKKFLENFN